MVPSCKTKNFIVIGLMLQLDLAQRTNESEDAVEIFMSDSPA